MEGSERHFLKRGLLALGGFIIAAIIQGIVEKSFNVNILAAIWRGSKTSFFWLIHPVGLPLILVATLTLLSATAIIMIALNILPKKTRTVESYKEDIFDDVLWAWDYDFQNRIHTMTPLCPTCRCEMKEQYLDAWTHGRGGMKLLCQICGYSSRQYADSSSMKERIGLEIQSRFNTGKFTNASERVNSFVPKKP